ncbi:hypothetical protein Ssi03_77020 [Sphaerisporangium siamense]|nr:hypothetical protein Ssi03_77020 [Sphaerisporangium siamense]
MYRSSAPPWFEWGLNRRGYPVDPRAEGRRPSVHLVATSTDRENVSGIATHVRSANVPRSFARPGTRQAVTPGRDGERDAQTAAVLC